MHEKIKDIQNSMWKAYTDFKESRDMRKYNQDMEKLSDRYRHDSVMLNFCQGLIFDWAPIINSMKRWS